MKKIFTVVGVAAALLVGSVGVMAFAENRHHDSGHEGHRAGFMIERLGRKLNLTDEQDTQLKALTTEARPIMKQGRQMMKSLRAEMMDFSSIGADYDTRIIRLADEQAELTRQLILQAADVKLKVAQILNEDQLVKLQELSESYEGRGKGKRHGFRFGGPGEDSLGGESPDK